MERTWAWPPEVLAARRERWATKTQERNRCVLAAAIEEAREIGWDRMTRRAIADRAGVSEGAVSNAFGGMSRLRDKVMHEAVITGLLDIVAQGLAAGHDSARQAPPDLKRRALATLT